MRFTRLAPRAFGRFTGEDAPDTALEGGLNVIYGPNEAGKSTLRQFIRGMLFGFKRYGTSRRYPLPQLEKYRPWVGNEYSGILCYEHDEVVYRVERDFARDEVHIYDDVTGEELTGSFPLDSRRERGFAREHLGLGERAFDNTICIGQLSSRPDPELAGDVKTYLANAASAGDAELSVEKALAALEGAILELGTSRTHVRRIDRAEEDLQRLTEEREAATQVDSRLRQATAAYDAAKAELESTNREYRCVMVRELTARRALAQRRLNRARDLETQLQSARDRLSAVEAYLHFPSEAREHVVRLQERLDSVEERMRTLEGQQQQLRDQLAEKIELQLRAEHRARNFILGMVTPGVLLTIGGIVAGLRVHQWGFVASALGVLLAAVGFIGRSRCRLGAAGAGVDRLRTQLAKVGAEYATETAMEGWVQRELEEQLEEAGVESASEFITACANSELADDLQRQLAAQEAELAGMLGESTVEELDQELSEVERALAEMSVDADGGSPEEHELESQEQLRALSQTRKLLEEQRTELLVEHERLSEELRHLEQSGRPLAEIEEEIEAAARRLDHLRFHHEALVLARDTIRELSDGLHREYAPELNKRAARIVTRLTAGRYSRVRVSSQLDVHVVVPETGTQKPVGALSRGTVDQFYFGLRLGIAELMTGRTDLPLLLDESFSQYDDNRLTRTLALVGALADERQVLLFTTRGRVLELLDGMNIQFHLVRLTSPGNKDESA